MEENPVIITNGYVLCCDPGNRAGRFHVLVRDGRIQEIGGSLEMLTALHPSATIIDATDKLIVPGLVNAHYHTLSFLLQELTAGKPFSSWKADRILRDHFQAFAEPGNADRLSVVARAASLAHLKSGTTCVGNFPPPVDAHGVDALVAAEDSIGLRSVMMLQTWDQIARVRQGKQAGRRFLVSLGREDDYTVYSFENHVRSAKELGCAVIAHAGEQRSDIDLVRRNFSKSLAALFRDFGALQPSTLLVHMNHAGKENVELLTEAGASLALCVASAARKQTGYPLLRMLTGRPARLCLGTDWGSTDMVAEMRFILNLPRLFAGMPVFSPLEVVRMGTINGAEALGVADEMGSIEVGKRADLTFFSLRDVRIPSPREGWTADKFAGLMLGSLSAQHVSEVMVGGRFLVSNGRSSAANEQDLIAELGAVRDGVLPTGEQRPQASLSVRAKVLAFTSGERTLTPEGELFIEGSAGVERSDSAGDIEQKPSPMPLRPSVTPHATVQPELSKNVKKVFGEDEDL